MIRLKEEKITRIGGLLGFSIGKGGATFILFLLLSCQKWYRSFLILGFTGFGIGYLMLGPAPFLTFLPQRFVTTLNADTPGFNLIKLFFCKCNLQL